MSMLAARSGEYKTSGETVNASLIPGADSTAQYVTSIAVSGDNVFLGYSNGVVSEYTTSGALINANLVSGLTGATDGIVVFESNLLISSSSGFREYTMSGTFLKALSGVIGGKFVIVPEPSCWLLSLTAITAGGLIFYKRRRTR